MSDEDISAGSRWLSNVSSELSEAQLGIICVTPENQNNPWLLFEAGALSKVIDQAHVCPFLIDLTPGQLAGPLSQFQANQVSFEGTSKIVFALNRLLGPAQIPDADLEEIFAVWWPKLEEKVKNAPTVGETTPKRTNDDILEEIISNTREQIRRENLRTALQRDETTKLDQMIETMQHYMLTFQKLSTIIDTIIAKTAMKTPEDIANIMQAMKPPSLSDMQQIIASGSNLTLGALV